MKRFAVTIAAVVLLGATPAALAAGTLSGKYKTTITGSTILGGALNGTWVINFTPGAYHVSVNGQPVVHGKNTVKGHVITFKDAAGSNACPTVGKYRFSLHGTTLTFKRIHDSTSANCLARGLVLKQKFTKV